MSVEEIGSEATALKEGWLGLQLLPSELFFFKTLVIPQKTKAKQIREFVSTALESLAPFPVDQLSWGFAQRELPDKTMLVLVYAALKERLQKQCVTLDHFNYVLPNFAVGFLLAQTGITFVKHGNQGMLFKGSSKKRDFVYDFWVNDENFCNHATVLSEAGLEQGEESIFFVELLTSNLRNTTGDVKLKFKQKQLGGQWNELEVLFPSEQLWDADIREKTFIAVSKRQRRLEHYIRTGIRAAFVFFALIVGVEILLAISKGGLWFKEKQRQKLQPRAIDIEGQDFLVRKIQRTVEQEIRPFELLDILNRLRPTSIYFLSSAIDNLHNVLVEAIAETANEVEKYRNALETSGYFESVHVENITATHQGTKFTLQCDFKETKPTTFLALENPS